MEVHAVQVAHLMSSGKGVGGYVQVLQAASSVFHCGVHLQGPLAGTPGCKFPGADGTNDPGYGACLVCCHFDTVLPKHTPVSQD